MTMLYKRAVADKDVYVESQDVSWSHTVTFAVNKEIGWKVVGDNVFCGDKQLYVVDNSGPEPSEGWVKASDDHIPFGATYSLVTPAPSYTLLSAATTADYGKVVCAAGHLHDAKTAVPVGCTAVGILGKVTETGHGLILSLQDATAQTWNTINGWTSVTTYAGTTLKVLPDDAARGTNLTSYTALGSTAVSNWAVAQKSDYVAIFTNLDSAITDWDGKTYDDNVNAYITSGVGGAALVGGYWSAITESGGGRAYGFHSAYWVGYSKTDNLSVRPVLGF